MAKSKHLTYEELEAEHQARQAEIVKRSKSRFTNMTRDQLFDYYIENARYMRDSPDKCYHIRICSEFLQNADTKALWEEVQKLVRKWQQELAPVNSWKKDLTS